MSRSAPSLFVSYRELGPPYGLRMNLATAGRVVGVMRPLLASALLALGSSFALVALHCGESIFAAAMLITPCSAAAPPVRGLCASQLVHSLRHPRHRSPERQRHLRI